MAASVVDGRLRVMGLGPLRAFVDGAEIELGPPKQRAVLAVLALCAGATVSREQLVDRVWGDAPPATAAGSLHTYLSGLRRVLGPVQDRLVSSRAGYCLLIEREAFDVAVAEDLAGQARASAGEAGAGRASAGQARASAGQAGAKLAAYERALEPWTTGTIFAGVPGPFVAQARVRLAGLRLQLLIGYAELAGQDMLPDVIGRLLAEVPAHPFDERLRGVLMSSLHRAGRTGDALAQYEDLRRVLAADLGISPAQATQAIYAGILAEDRNQGLAPAAGPAGSAAGLAAGPVSGSAVESASGSVAGLTSGSVSGRLAGYVSGSAPGSDAGLAGPAVGSASGFLTGSAAGSESGDLAGLAGGPVPGDLAGSAVGSGSGGLTGSAVGPVPGDLAGLAGGPVPGFLAGSAVGSGSGGLTGSAVGPVPGGLTA